jgi:hypothetical protein
MAGLHDGVQSGYFLLSYAVCHGRIAEQDFVADNAAFAGGNREKLLGNDGAKDERKL